MTVIYLAVIFFVALDRFLKVFTFANQASEVNLLGEILKFSYKNNYYMAFSLPLAGRWLNAIICLIILLLIYYLVRAWQAGKQEAVIYLLTITMAAGSNLFDRLKYGFVIDYLDLKYFIVFNLADAMITVGVFFLLLNVTKKEAD